MARIGRWGGGTKASQKFPDDAGAAGLRARHLLLLPTTVPVSELDDLVRARVPDADLARTGEAKLGRHCRLHGPYRLSMEDAVDAAVPMPWTLAYAVDAPVERDVAPEPGAEQWDPYARAFPDGLPWREEARALQFLTGLARRLHGAIRVSATTASGQLIQPDPDRCIDILIHAPVWLDPEVVHGLVARVVPGAALAVAGTEWSGPAHREYDPVRETVEGDTLTREEFEAIHAMADASDLAALAGGHTVDAYAVVGALGAAGVDGEVDVLAHVNDDGDPAVAAEAWAGRPFVTYEIRWASPDPQQREALHPAPEFIAARERVRPLIRQIARSLAEASGGVVIDEEGFPLNRYEL